MLIEIKAVHIVIIVLAIALMAVGIWGMNKYRRKK